MDLGHAIRLVRKELDLTQAELSEKAGISQTALSQIEKGGKTSFTKDDREDMQSCGDTGVATLHPGNARNRST